MPPIANEDPEENEIKRKTGVDTSCCTFVFLILILSLSAYCMTERRDIYSEYWL